MIETIADAADIDARRVAALALEEDGDADVTSEVTVGVEQTATGVIEARGDGVFAGHLYADAVADLSDAGPIAWQVRDGERYVAGVVLGTLTAPLRAVLRAERPLLNLLQRASGIATATRLYVDAVADTGCRILHTRKTAPGLRMLDVAAVIAGGGRVHRINLSRTVMVKDNHWKALVADGDTLHAALLAARTRGIAGLYVEVESVAQLDEACEAGATRIMIDNQTPETVAIWAKRARAAMPTVEIEATGGITLANVRAYAEAGADFISVGALTHSVRAADLALEVKSAA